MRTVIAAALFLLSSTAAIANQCYWINHHPYCDAGCRVVDRWWDGSGEWMRYSCIPHFLTEPLFFVFTAIAVVLVGLAFMGAISSTSSTALPQATDEADAQAEEAQRITERLKAARADADKFLSTYRDR